MAVAEKVATKPELEGAIVEIWETAQNAEGSRAGMQEALDYIQEQCSDVIPDVEERATGIEAEEEEEDEEEDGDD